MRPTTCRAAIRIRPLVGRSISRHSASASSSYLQRRGVVLAPEAPYELNEAGGGVEDPRITYLAACRLYVMTYTAYGPTGPRIAAALSRDLLHWRRTGLVGFDPLHGINLAEY